MIIEFRRKMELEAENARMGKEAAYCPKTADKP
jgi:hypothetical protein